MRAASVRGELGLAGMKGCRGHVSCWLLLGKDLRLKWPIFLSTSATKGQSSCPQVLEAEERKNLNKNKALAALSGLILARSLSAQPCCPLEFLGRIPARTPVLLQ